MGPPEKITNATSSNQSNLPQPTLLLRLRNLLHSSQWSDCIFIVGDGNKKQEFRAHRLMLASCSPVFEAMCYGPLAETQVIAIPDLEPLAFQTLLEYVYTESVQFHSVEETCDVLYAAKKYMLSNLLELCRCYIINNLQVSEVVSVYEYAKVLQEEVLFEPCLRMMRKYALEILTDADHHISSDSIAELLSSEALNGCECCIIDGALLWAAKECEQRGVPPTGPNQRSVLSDCGAWMHLRFLTLTSEQFASITKIEELLTVEERFAIQDFVSQSLVPADEGKRASCLKLHRNIITSYSIPSSVGEINCNNFSSNVVVVKDKWKRRRLNIVLVGAVEDKVSKSDETKEDPPLTSELCDPCIPKVSLPQSISGIFKQRREVGYRRSFCQRLLMKPSVTMSSPLALHMMLRVSSPIDLRGVQMYTRIIPSSIAPNQSNHYNENLDLEILDDRGIVLSRKRFTEKVEYNTEQMVPLKWFVRLSQDRNYSIIVRFPNAVADYPMGFLGRLANSQGISFNFFDGVEHPATGNFVTRLDMGFITGLAYS